MGADLIEHEPFRIKLGCRGENRICRKSGVLFNYSIRMFLCVFNRLGMEFVPAENLQVSMSALMAIEHGCLYA